MRIAYLGEHSFFPVSVFGLPRASPPVLARFNGISIFRTEMDTGSGRTLDTAAHLWYNCSIDEEDTKLNAVSARLVEAAEQTATRPFRDSRAISKSPHLFYEDNSPVKATQKPLILSVAEIVGDSIPDFVEVSPPRAHWNSRMEIGTIKLRPLWWSRPALEFHYRGAEWQTLPAFWTALKLCMETQVYPSAHGKLRWEITTVVDALSVYTHLFPPYKTDLQIESESRTESESQFDSESESETETKPNFKLKRGSKPTGPRKRKPNLTPLSAILMTGTPRNGEWSLYATEDSGGYLARVRWNGKTATLIDGAVDLNAAAIIILRGG